MAQTTDIVRNTIKRDGVSQRQRRAPALDPSAIQIDGRTLEDFLVFALEFSKQVWYFNLSDQRESDWQDFWKCDPTVVIAAIEKTNPLPLKKTYEQILPDTPGITGLHQLIQTLTGIARQIDFWYVNLMEGSDFKTEIQRLIGANFNTLLPLLVSYEKGAKSLFPNYPGPLREDYTGFSGVWHFSLSAWDDIEPNISLYQPKVEIGSDEPVACIADFSEAERLAAAYARLSELLTNTYNVYFHIIQISPGYFKDSLARKDHPPHLALFITFLMLYQQVQADLNGFTAKHLDFFYKDVLGLKTKAAVPDKVHLFFELAKNVPEYELLALIRFKAGKDNAGKDLFYTLDKNTVLNTGKVESLRTVFLEFEDDDELVRRVKNIRVARVANSADGLGAEITDKENPSWATLGSDGMPKAALGFAIASNELLLSEGTRTVTLHIFPQTPLSAFTLTPKLFDTFDIWLSGEKEWIKVRDWIKAGTTPSLLLSDPANSQAIRIEFTMGPEAPAVVPFNAKNLKEDLGTTLPVMKLLLHQPADVGTDTHYHYELLRRLKIAKIQMTVTVDGIQQVMAFNDEGAVDTKKPFMPFGSSPKAGSSFYVGNAETFQKSLDTATLKLEWEGVPQNFSRYYQGYEFGSYDSNGWPQIGPANFGVKCYIQKNGTAQNITGATDPRLLFDNLTNSGTDPNAVVTNHKNDIVLTHVQLAHAFPAAEIENYGIETKDGFIKIDLQRDFEHDQFQNVLTRQMLAAAKLPDKIGGAFYITKHNSDDTQPNKIEKLPFSTNYVVKEVVIPKAPYTPVLKSLTLNYTSTADTTVAADQLHFLHLHPFPNTYQHFENPGGRFLLPQFTTGQTDPFADVEEIKTSFSAAPVPATKVTGNKTSRIRGSNPKFVHLPSLPLSPTSLEEGALLIGLSQLRPRQSLLILFQVVENSADAEIDKAKLRWHFLADNSWHSFEEHQVVSDTTDELTTSGIVELSIPEGINQNSTILPSELHWLKVSVTQNAGAVSRLINVHAQAARATFQDNANDPAHLEKPLAAELIAKLEAADSALKSINQPYESFGGLPAETPLNFYTRISERLRHKGRAIAQFDYERLILEAFPAIYKVKCVNHTDKDYQLHPGHVLISVVPDFTKLKAVDRFEPKVTLARLEEIKRYLEVRNTAFVCASDTTLHVLNPDYQEFAMDFEVRFTPDVTAVDFHVRKLREAIIRFLSPWAYEDGAEINFGGKMYKSSILNFVEEQPYVDYVAKFKMMRHNTIEDINEIEADNPRSILVPDRDNITIRPILIDDYCPAENLKKGDTLGYLPLEETPIN